MTARNFAALTNPANLTLDEFAARIKEQFQLSDEDLKEVEVDGDHWG